MRVVNLLAVLLFVSPALAGVEVTLRPHELDCCRYPPGEICTLDVFLQQTGSTGDKLLRMIQFDLNASDPDLTITTPITHELATATIDHTGSDIRFWTFNGVPACDALPTSCGAHHFIVDELDPAEPIEPGPGVISVTFGSDTQLNANAVYQIDLPGDGSPVMVGQIDVTMPYAAGSYRLDLLNSGETNPDAGAQIRFGFGCQGNMGPCADPITVWRASGPNLQITGGKFEILPCEPPLASVVKWESVGYHGGNFDGDVAFEIAPRLPNAQPSFSEPRLSGLQRIRVTFDGPIDAPSTVPGNIIVRGIDENGSPVDLSGTTMATSLLSAGTQLEIEFSPSLPRFGVYTVELNGVTAWGGVPVGGDTSRCMSAVLGDINGDLRVTASDVAGTGSFVPTNPIDPTYRPISARADANGDGRIQANDVAGIATLVGHNLRGIQCP